VQLTSDESLNTELMNNRSESTILTRLMFYSPVRQSETIYEKFKVHIIVTEPSQYMPPQINI